MPAVRRLLTGPYGGALRERLLEEPAGLWLVPSMLARAQVREALGGGWATASRAPRVWCWNDLWQAVREATDDGPAVLSEAGSRAVLIEAIHRARGAGELRDTAAVSRWPGFRRRVRQQVDAWTRQERPVGREPPPGGPGVADAWAVFGHYRRLLDELAAEDAEGLAVWASRALGQVAPPELRRTSSLPVSVIDLEHETPAVGRVLRWFEEKAKRVRVVLAFDPDPALAEVFAVSAPIRQRLLERGYVEESAPQGFYRPQGLRDLERRLFRDDRHELPLLGDARGLALVGAPQGDGVGLVVARAVKHWLDEGVAPEDLLVLVRHWDDDAAAVLEVLRAWGLPVSAPDRPRRLASDPALSTLRLALGLPVDGWEADCVVKLLRYGQFRPEWPEIRAADLPAMAASALHDAPVYRGRGAILEALDRSIDAASDDPTRRADAIAIRALVGRLIAEVALVDRSGTRREHAWRLRKLAASLGLEPALPRNDALDVFWAALDDHATTRDQLGQEDESIDLAGFAAEVEALVGDLEVGSGPAAPGTVIMTTVDAAAGARAAHVILANLAEGTFPTRESIELNTAVSGEDDEAAAGSVRATAFAREMARFLRVIGSAEASVVLAYPTRDDKGQEVLPAGFLDDVTRCFEPATLAAVHESYTRFEPTFLDRPELAVAPADARVRAVALACLRRDDRAVRTLAADPAQRPALLGAARALDLTRWRLHSRAFSRYDGLLTDAQAIAAIADRFGAACRFSPSQLESYLYCPFQFYLKFVLGLRPVEDRDELEEDFTARGTRIHKLLENLERRLLSDGGSRLDVVEAVIQEEMQAAPRIDSKMDLGRQMIDQRRLERTLRLYVAQAEDYMSKGESPPRPQHFEVLFGDPKRGSRYPELEIGAGDARVRIRGSIDRVDLYDTPGGPTYRVIDYKTGPCPSATEVKALEMVQLPLYALAAERLLLREEGARFGEIAYWELRDRGYRAVKIDWESLQAQLEAKVLDVVDRLRRGLFVVQPRRDDCTSHCDYRAVCRIGQLRHLAKRLPGGSDLP